MFPAAAAVVAGPPKRYDCAGAAISSLIVSVLPQNPNPNLAKKGEVSRVGKQLPTLIDLFTQKFEDYWRIAFSDD